MKKNILTNKDFLIIIFLFIFSSFINQYYGNRGVFPHDSFAHFETGFRILLGEHPFKNYWIISGPFIDYLQGMFFYFFGVSWQIYLLHASIFNGIITIATFLVLRNFKLNLFYSFIYSLLFSILAYPSSGTPFVDHHSTFLSLLGIYSLLLAIEKEINFYWIFFPIFFICAFLSKQVPTSYILIPIIFILCFYLFEKKKYKSFVLLTTSGSLFILAILLFGFFSGITLTSFMEQYILYPQTIAETRFRDFTSVSSLGFFGHFKFIFISFLPLLYINFKNLFSLKKYYKQKNFYYFLIIFFYTLSLIFHQILTKNQTFIFFLIPILVAFSHIYLNKVKPIFNYLILIFCLFVTIKYHLRFNEGRKFHELINSDFEVAIDAEKIDRSLRGLKWITPGNFNKRPESEINLINETKRYLNKEKREFMIMTNYSFFSVILQKKTYSPTRWHTGDGTDYPREKGKYFNSYRNLLIESIKTNNLEVIYIIYPIKESSIYNYISSDCFDVKKINKFLTGYELKKCKDLL